MLTVIVTEVIIENEHLGFPEAISKFHKISDGNAWTEEADVVG